LMRPVTLTCFPSHSCRFEKRLAADRKTTTVNVWLGYGVPKFRKVLPARDVNPFATTPSTVASWPTCAAASLSRIVV
jgi:hypothetical protein